MSEELRAKRYLVSGRVQGVGFRWYTRNAAEKVGVVGIVRNLRDGRVEAIAVGSSEQHEQFRSLIAEGPSHSHVTDINIEELDRIPHYPHFDIFH